MMTNRNLLAFLLVLNVALLSHVVSSRRHSFHRINKQDVVAEIGSEIELYVDRPYVEWYKKPDLQIGASVDNEYHQIKKVGQNKYRSLIVKKANLTDGGNEVYRAEDDDLEKFYFNIHLFSKTFQASLILNSDKSELAVGENMFEMDRDTSDNELIYRVEALPLDHLLVNSYPVDAKPCQAENSDLNCLEFNLLSAINLEKCTDNVKIDLSYSFNNSEWYSQQIKPMTFIASIDLRFPAKVSNTQQTIVYDDDMQSEELSCEVECANPAEDYEYKWSLGDEVLFCSTETNKYTVDISAMEEKANSTSFDVICTVSNEIEPSNDKLNESQAKFHMFKKGTVTTTMKPIATTPSAFASNGTSEIGFFANLYNKVKFLVSFNV